MRPSRRLWVHVRFSGTRNRALRHPAVALLLFFGLAAGAGAQTGTHYPLPTTFSGPFSIVAGPDGNLWFTESGSPATRRIGRITPSGTITEFTTPSLNKRPQGMTVGPDGAIWFCAPGGATDHIGRATTAGVITEIPVPTMSGPTEIALGPDGNFWIGDGFFRIHRMTPGGAVTTFPTIAASPVRIARGADGNVWYTDVFNHRIGRVTPAGVVTEFPTPTPSSQPDGIVAGPDGNMWFTERVGDNIGRITPAGVITEFPIPLPAASARGIAPGPDGNLYFAIRGGAAPGPGMTRLGRVSMTGVVTVLTFPSTVPGGGPNQDGIVEGSDGAMWLTSFNGNRIERVALAGVADPGGSNFTEYPICTTPNSGPDGIRTGPDGNLWFVEGLGNNVGRITPGGVITEFPITTPGSQPQGIGAGPDNAMWFAETAANQIGRISMAGVVTEFPIPTPNSMPIHISLGPDGAMWFTENAGNKIGRITTAGVITEFTVPSPNSGPQEVITGPDGNLWFTEIAGNRIGRLTPGGVFTEFPVPTAGSGPADLTVGSDGALWFTESNQNRIGRITTAGTITEFPIPSPSTGPFGITSGPDGALWFTELNGNRIGRMTTAGAFREFPIPTPNSQSYGITTGPDNALWFTEFAGNKIGRLTLGGPSAGNRLISPSFPVLADTDGSGLPGAGDTALLVRQAGALFTILGPWEDCAGAVTNVVTGSNRQGGTGPFQTYTRVHEGWTEEITVGGFTAGNHPTTASMQVTGPGVNRTGSGSFVDSTGDGIPDGIMGTESGGGGLNFSMSFVFSDVTGDARPDYVSLPWAAMSALGVRPIPGTTNDPQVWVPLADTTGDGVPDSIVADLDGNGAPDADFFSSPRLRRDRVLNALSFYTLPPCRVLDTRDPNGPFGGPALPSGVPRNFTAAGRCGIPAGTAIISANITVTGPASQGHLTLYPAGTTEPVVSSMNFGPGQTRANNVILTLGPAGDFTVRPVLVTGTTHFILDVNGYFADPGAGGIVSLRAAGLPGAAGAPELSDWIVLALTAGVCPAGWVLLKRRRSRR